MTARWHSAAEIVGHLGGKWHGQRSRCRCPVKAHSSDKSPLAVSQTKDGRVLVFCHAGCDQRTVIGALQFMGLWGEGEVTGDPSYPGFLTTRHDGADDKDERLAREYALSLWDAAREAKSTPVEAYLRARGIRLPVSAQLRYAPHLSHSPSKRSFPAMVARISDDRGFCAVQRTYLAADRPAKADVTPNKMSKGPMSAGAVRLRMPVTDTLGLAEGIETALSASQLYSIATWATLSAHRLGKIEIPKTIRSLIIFGDAGEVGREQAFAAADVYERRGLHVEIIFPAAHFAKNPGKDFNDALREAR